MHGGLILIQRAQKDRDVDRDQGVGDKGRAPRGVVVADRKHAAESGSPSRKVKRENQACARP